MQTFRLLKGKWVHEEDSLSTITVRNKQWTYYYGGEQLYERDTILVTNSLPQYADPKKKGEFLLLISNHDTTYYEIMGLDDNILSLLHFPSGRIHVYNKKK